MNLVHREWVNQSNVQRGTKLDAYFIPQECTLLFVVNQKIVREDTKKHQNPAFRSLQKLRGNVFLI